MPGEDPKLKIISLIDENAYPWRKAAYYSDPEVSAIMTRLYERWEASGREGRPIDHATPEELEILAGKAEKYAFMDEEAARALAFSRMGGGEGGGKGESSLAAFIRAFLGRKRD